MIEQENIDLLFNQTIEEDIHNTIEDTSIHIKEKERLQSIYSLSEDNIDEAFNAITHNQYEYIYDEYIGKTFNEWTVIKFSHLDKGQNKLYVCLCSCGNEGVVRTSRLKNGKSKKCLYCVKKESAIFLTNINNSRSPLNKILEDTLINKIINNKKIIKVTTINNKLFCYYQCQCGNEGKAYLKTIKKKNNNYCRSSLVLRSSRKKILCLKCPERIHLRKLNPKIGETYGNRTIIEVNNIEIKGDRALKCQCACGNEILIRIKDFYRKQYNSCLKCIKYNKEII